MAAPIKQGFMDKRHHKGKIGKQWTKRWVLLYDISDSGIPRLETFDSCELTSTSKQGMIVPLNTDVHKIVASSQAPKRDYTIDIFMVHDKVHTFAVETKAEQESWLLEMRRVANLGKRSSLTPHNKYDPHNPHRKLSTQTSDSSSIDSFQAEENTLYDSYDVKTYTVHIQDNDFTLHTLKLRGTYVISVDSLKLTLVHPEKGHILYTWPYKYLRRYGRDKVSFSMEAGRKCQSGPGLIKFDTDEGNDIFHQIQNFVNSISGSQPLNAAQKMKNGNKGNVHGSNEELNSQVKKMSLGKEVKPPEPHVRSHSLTTNQPITKTKAFIDKIAARREQLYADSQQFPASSSQGSTPEKTYDDFDDIYSEVSEKDIEDQARMPKSIHGRGEYDIAGDIIARHGGSPAPPDSDEYDELNPVAQLYTDPKEGGNGEAWRTFGLPADNIHTDNYVSGQSIASNQVARGSDSPRMPSGVVHTDRRRSSSPKVRPRQEQRKMQPNQQQQPRHEPDESLYSIASGPNVTIPSVTQNTSPPQATGNEVYDHLNWSKAKPTPVPRKTDASTPSAFTRKPPTSSKPRPVAKQREAPIYDHLDRQNKGNANPSAVAAKPKKMGRQTPKLSDPNPTYGTLYKEEEPAPPEESAYGTLFRNNQSGNVGMATEDESGYLTQAALAQELYNEGDYDEPMRPEILRMQQGNTGEDLYDFPDVLHSV